MYAYTTAEPYGTLDAAVFTFYPHVTPTMSSLVIETADPAKAGFIKLNLRAVFAGGAYFHQYDERRFDLNINIPTCEDATL